MISFSPRRRLFVDRLTLGLGRLLCHLAAAMVLSLVFIDCVLYAIEDESFAIAEDSTASNDEAKPRKTDAKSLTDELAKSAQRLTGQTYHLKYQFERGQTFYWTVEHAVKTETSILGKSERTRSYSLATKKWEVMDVSKEGVATVFYSLVDAEMNSKVDDQPEIRYSSRSNETPAESYEHIASAIGKPLATVEMKASGEVIKKQTNYRNIDMGMGEFTIVLPETPIKIGHKWETAERVMARNKDRGVKYINLRRVYELTEVKHGVATIRMRTEILTPIYDPDIESQIIQKLSNGVIKFDIDNGRLFSKEIEWDQQVQGFQVPDSLMVYRARMTETYTDEQIAASFQTAQRLEIKSPDGPPILRR